MAIIVKDGGGGNFTPHPEGQYAAVCVDIHELGEIETKWGRKHKIDLYFYCGYRKHDEQGNEVTDDEGRPIYLFVRERFTPTLSEKGNLRPFLERWRQKKFTPEELKGFDLEKLLGASAYIQISHNEWEGKKFANIDTIMKLPKGETAPVIPSDYVRFCDRQEQEEPAVGVGASGSPFAEDDDLPF
jgi:hypothetical protein